MPQPKKSPGRGGGAPAGDDAQSTLAAIRDLLTRSVMLPSDRLRETIDDAVRRGRITRADAEELVDRLVALGRQQTEDALNRTRRAAGLGSSFPIASYDDLTAAQISERLDELSASDLRKVRDYEKRNANRKSVLGAIERRLR
jgi:polyhydroxyalkanoate synthesis regulator phasin